MPCVGINGKVIPINKMRSLAQTHVIHPHPATSHIENRKDQFKCEIDWHCCSNRFSLIPRLAQNTGRSHHNTQEELLPNELTWVIIIVFRPYFHFGHARRRTHPNIPPPSTLNGPSSLVVLHCSGILTRSRLSHKSWNCPIISTVLPVLSQWFYYY